VVPGDSIERTAARCVELLKDPAKAKAMGERGARGSREVAVGLIADILRRLLDPAARVAA